jgi:hypothetical protein
MDLDDSPKIHKFAEKKINLFGPNHPNLPTKTKIFSARTTASQTY